MIAPGRANLQATKNLLEQRRESLFGVKILVNGSYQLTYDNKHGNYGVVACMLRNVGAEKIMIDAKSANDSLVEMGDITRSIQAGYMRHKPDGRQKKNRPDFQTVHHAAPRQSLEVFLEESLGRGIAPVCFTTSSRYTEADFEDSGTTSAKFIEASTKAVSLLGFGAVMCAACDAEAVKSENPDLIVFATGGILHPGEVTSHVRTALIEEVKDYVDVFVLGSSVLHANDVVAAYDVRKQAAS